MNTLFNNNDDKNDKISLDALYDRKREVDKNRLDIYHKILKRIHHKIQLTSRQRYNEQFIFYVVPEFIIGVPRYDINHCIIYVIEKLEKNGFVIKYTHPNMLFISWNHYIPSYKRNEIKNKYGVTIDGFGNEVKSKNKGNLLLTTGHNNTSSSSSSSNSNFKTIKPKKDYKDINLYKSEGIYNNDLIHSINNRIN